MGDTGGGWRARAVVRARVNGEERGASVRIRVGDILHAHRGGTVEEDLPSCRIREIRRRVDGARRRGHYMEEWEVREALAV